MKTKSDKNMKKKTIRKIILGLLLCFTVNAVYEIQNVVPVFADTVVVNATNVNVRSEPNTKCKSYGKVSKGNTFERSEKRTDGWSCIQYGKTKAYIKSDFLTPVTAATATAASTLTGGSASVTSSTPSKQSCDYIANTNTGKFHYPGCKSVKKMSEKNKWYFTGTRDELISSGYVPCKNCNP